MFWEFRSLIRTIKDELQGWDDFKKATGEWPVYSILASTLSFPVFLGSYLYVSLKALETGNRPLIYATSLGTIICFAALWYGIRRLACKTDVAKAKKTSKTHTSNENLERLIR